MKKDQTLSDLLLRTPYSPEQLEEALRAGRSAGLSDRAITRLVFGGGPKAVYAVADLAPPPGDPGDNHSDS